MDTTDFLHVIEQFLVKSETMSLMTYLSKKSRYY